ncbi:NAD-dependent epimerase/dehydratase family protein [Bradyrhizobium sp.]|uniref:NAD-dependent epimerase/dehydratase family protein n=1 Tax=Bradyrhizobium sp. TaxID=376 RepID=UPI004037BFBE
MTWLRTPILRRATFAGDDHLREIVVTGASGFLGRALMAELSHGGLPAMGVCRRALNGMHRVADYRDTPSADVLIHLAEEPDRAVANRVDAASCDQSDVIRRLSARAGKIIYASSGVVYGDNGRAPFATDHPVHGYDLYSRLKIANERVVLDAGGTVLRLANLYGAGMSPNNVISDIARQIPGDGALRIRDDRPVRDFLAVTDAARAFALATKATVRGILNIGTGKGHSIGQVAKLALEVAGQPRREIVATSPSGKPSVNVLEVSETLRRLGWSSTRSLRDYFLQVLSR